MMATLQKHIGEQKKPPSAVGSRLTNTKSLVPRKVSNSVRHVSEEERRKMIATSAYLRAQCRNFCPGEEENDWFAAEAEIDTMLGKA